MSLESYQDYLVYLLIAIFIAYTIYFFFIKKESVPEQWKASAINEEEDEKPVEQPKDEDLLEMTLEELRLYDGKKNPKIYIGVKNIVFDCTSNELYQEGGAYNLFAGYEASVSLSRMSFEQKDLNIYNTEKLNASEIDILEEWYAKFNFKYLRIARIVETKKDQ